LSEEAEDGGHFGIPSNDPTDFLKPLLKLCILLLNDKLMLLSISGENSVCTDSANNGSSFTPHDVGV